MRTPRLLEFAYRRLGLRYPIVALAAPLRVEHPLTGWLEVNAASEERE